jgi:hypothetical protein
MSSTREYRLSMANLIADTFVPGVIFYEGASGLRMSWDNRKQTPRYDFPAVLRSDGSWPKFGYRQRPTGGTGFQAMAQLIRYIRDLPRLPLVTWEYWAGASIQLGAARTIELLRASDYGNPDKTRCVLCGTLDFKGLDWWSLDGITGPSCFGGRCIPGWMSAPVEVRFRDWLRSHRAEVAA